MALAPTQSLVETPSRAFYRQAMEVLRRGDVPFLVGGAFAFVHQAGIDRSTKDLDIFLRPADVHRLLEVCAAAGYEAELVFSHWLAKVRSSDGFIDVIFSSGNGIAVVDDPWFHHATEQNVLGLTVLVAPAEESIWSKAFVMERERFDGADVAHIILPTGTGSTGAGCWNGSARTGACCWRIWCCSASSSRAPARACQAGSCRSCWAVWPPRSMRRTPRIPSATARSCRGRNISAMFSAAAFAMPASALTAR